MKQIAVTSDILDKLRKVVSSDIRVENLAVFEAIALNELPLRKKHPLYNKAVTSTGTLQLMLTQMLAESVPVQLMHEGGMLPAGRVFDGKLLQTETGAELRVLFFVDKTETALIAKIDNGTIDQVSVSILPEHILCSECGWDFLGKEATFDHIYSGTCENDHTLGEEGCHARLIGLDTWSELSLVGRGGARNARIVAQDKSVFGPTYQRLAASGLDPNALVLSATATEGKFKMDLTQLVDQLTSAKADLTATTAKVATLEAGVVAKDTEIATLTQQLADAGEAAVKLAEKDARIADLEAQLTKATEALTGVAQTLLVAGGKVDGVPPADLDAVVALISEKSTALAAAYSKAGQSLDAIADADKAKVVNLGGFRVSR